MFIVLVDFLIEYKLLKFVKEVQKNYKDIKVIKLK